MDNKVFIRLQQSLYEIKNILLSDSEIRKLLYYSTSELKKSGMAGLKEVTQEAVSDNIYLLPVVDIDTDPPFDKSNFISVHMTNGSCSDAEEMSYAINVSIMSEKHDWVIEGNIRPLYIAQKVIDLLDGKKLDLAVPIYFSRISQQIINDDVYGYALIFAASDGAHNAK